MVYFCSPSKTNSDVVSGSPVIQQGAPPSAEQTATKDVPTMDSSKVAETSSDVGNAQTDEGLESEAKENTAEDSTTAESKTKNDAVKES